MKYSFFLTVFFLILGSAQVFAGAEGHGGTGLICPTAKVSFQLFDLFQASLPGVYSEAGLTINRTRNTSLSEQDDVKQQVEGAFKKLEKMYPDLAASARSQLREIRIIPTKPGEVLPVLDIGNEDHARIPSECKDGLVGVMYWHDTEKNPDRTWLKVDYTQLHRLPVTDQAALWVHEGITRADRLLFYLNDKINPRIIGHYPEGIASVVRGFNGYLFSTYNIYDASAVHRHISPHWKGPDLPFTF